MGLSTSGPLSLNERANGTEESLRSASPPHPNAGEYMAKTRDILSECRSACANSGYIYSDEA